MKSKKWDKVNEINKCDGIIEIDRSMNEHG